MKTALVKREESRARKRTQRAKARKRGPRGPRRPRMDTIGVHDPRTGCSKHVEVQSRRPSSGPRSITRRFPVGEQKREPRAVSAGFSGRSFRTVSL